MEIKQIKTSGHKKTKIDTYSQKNSGNGNLINEIAQQIARVCADQFDVQLTWIGLLQNEDSLNILARWPSQTRPFDVESEILPEYLASITQTKKNLIKNIQIDNRSYRIGLFPLIVQDIVIGVLGLASVREGFFTSDRLHFFRAFSLLAASSIQNARLYQIEKERVQQIQTLRVIDQEILSSFDLDETANLVLTEAAYRLGVDAADILVVRPGMSSLEFVCSYGFKFEDHQKTSLSIEDNFVGLPLLDKNIVQIDHLTQNSDPQRTSWFKKEGFEVYIGSPLIARGELRGLLELFHRGPLEPDQEWFSFLEIIANHIAIAIDKSLLLENLHQANTRLSDDYNATIDAFSHALELRDRETEGHTRRVSQMTIRLAQDMGIQESFLDNIRKGALLHDIGKLGIPDAILLKPGPLNEREWEIMHQHPLYAEQILSRIEHLQPALDIPVYHHEKWDGSGYPHGLRGEEIPLEARIFAIIDVFDALTSDRPYRKAMNKHAAFQYIQGQSGKHFDPNVVQAFFKMVT